MRGEDDVRRIPLEMLADRRPADMTPKDFPIPDAVFGKKTGDAVLDLY